MENRSQIQTKKLSRKRCKTYWHQVGNSPKLPTLMLFLRRPVPTTLRVAGRLENNVFFFNWINTNVETLRASRHLFGRNKPHDDSQRPPGRSLGASWPVPGTACWIWDRKNHYHGTNVYPEAEEAHIEIGYSKSKLIFGPCTLSVGDRLKRKWPHVRNPGINSEQMRSILVTK